MKVYLGFCCFCLHVHMYTLVATLYTLLYKTEKNVDFTFSTPKLNPNLYITCINESSIGVALLLPTRTHVQSCSHHIRTNLRDRKMLITPFLIPKTLSQSSYNSPDRI